MTTKRKESRPNTTFSKDLERESLYIALVRKPEVGEFKEALAPPVMHCIAAEDGRMCCALFTSLERLHEAGQMLGWTTEGGPLQFCSMKARDALEAVLEMLDDENYFGLSIDLTVSSMIIDRATLAQMLARNPGPKPS
jgi:hypothetical protein